VVETLRSLVWLGSPGFTCPPGRGFFFFGTPPTRQALRGPGSGPRWMPRRLVRVKAPAPKSQRSYSRCPQRQWRLHEQTSPLIALPTTSTSEHVSTTSACGHATSRQASLHHRLLLAAVRMAAAQRLVERKLTRVNLSSNLVPAISTLRALATRARISAPAQILFPIAKSISGDEAWS